MEIIDSGFSLVIDPGIDITQVFDGTRFYQDLLGEQQMIRMKHHQSL